MGGAADREIKRQFRVLGQMISMHTALRDRYAWRSTAVVLVLLACSVIFCATTFVSDTVLAAVGLAADRTRVVLGIASVTAFFASLAELKLDWRGRSARHREAAHRLTAVLAEFRKRRTDDGLWPPSCHAKLKDTYSTAMDEIVPIPESQFLALKARYLRKVAISKMLDDSYGLPIIWLRLLLLFNSIRGRPTINTTATDPPVSQDESDEEQTSRDKG